MNFFRLFITTLIIIFPLKTYALYSAVSNDLYNKKPDLTEIFFSYGSASTLLFSDKLFNGESLICTPVEISQSYITEKKLEISHDKCLDFDINKYLNKNSASYPLPEYSSINKQNSFLIRNDYNSNKSIKRIVDRNINIFTYKLKKRFSIWLSRSTKYLPLFKKIIKENELPEELVYLSLIESGFNPRAYSRAHAVGPWQFIKGTARLYGLKINFWVDERRDPIKSTHAASLYLKKLYEQFGSWELAIAAYNAGEGRIAKAIRRTRSRDFWRIYRTRYIKSETKNYIPKFLAAREIASKPEAFGFKDVVYSPTLNFDAVKVSPPANLNFIAKIAGTSVSKIRQLNPELRRSCIPPDVKDYILRIPSGKKEEFLAKYNSASRVKRARLKRYIIRKGETLSDIARRERVPLRALFKINKIRNPRRIRAGTLLLLPLSKASYKSSKEEFLVSYNSTSKDKRARLKRYIIRKGETLSDIARRERVPLRALFKINKIRNPRRIRAGTLLLLPPS